MKKFLRPLCSTAIAFYLIVSADVVAADSSGDGTEEEVDYAAKYVEMVAELEKRVKKAKHQMFLLDGKRRKMKKSIQASGWRVDAARERFDEKRAKLPSSGAQPPELAREHALLEKEIVKVGTMLDEAESMYRELMALKAAMITMRDDVSIESDRFEPEARGQARARAAMHQAEWLLAKIDELKEDFAADISEPASHVLSRATIGLRSRASAPEAMAEPGEFEPLSAVSLSALRRSTDAGHPVKVGSLSRDGGSCDVYCSIDDPSDISGGSGHLQLLCVGGDTSALSSSGRFVLSSWNAGSPTFPAYSRVNRLTCH